MQATLQKSTRKDKRYMVQLQTPDGMKTIHFGSPSYNTQGSREKRTVHSTTR